jgi:phage baseplate assembly protein V
MRAALDRVASRVRLMVSRFVLQSVNDAAKLQSVQIMALEGQVRDLVERFQQYGYTSVPHPGAEGIAVSLGGNTDHMVVINVDDRRYRLTGLQEGEVALYTDEGDKIVLKRGRNIEVTAGTKVTLITPLTVLTGDLDVGGNVTVDGRIDSGGDQVAGGISTVHHTHGGVKRDTAFTDEPS